MRKKNFLIMVSMCILVILTSVSAWAVPDLINYQGKLVDIGGTPLNGNYEMDFLIYDVASGGSPLWEETQTVVMREGIYNVKLGEVSSFPLSLFEGDNLYLEVVVETETMIPRQRLTSVAYAMKAHLSEGVVTGAINTTMIADGAVASNNIQDGATIVEITDDDGSGSGLDADLLDGFNSSDFATAEHTHDGRYYTEAEVDTIVSNLQDEICEETLLAVCKLAIMTGSNLPSAQCPSKIVFVTSVYGNGNLGSWPDAGGNTGVAAANAICQARADAGDLSGTYKAWISDGQGNSPLNNFTISSVPYVLPDQTTVVANDWDDLVDGSLNYIINVDEYGNTPLKHRIWTGTRPNGTPIGNYCNDWSDDTNLVTGRNGYSFELTGGWTQWSNNLCDWPHYSLYCFQQ